MPYQPGVLASPDNDGVIIVYESDVLHFKGKNGDYWFEDFTVKPTPPRRYAVSLLVPNWMTKC